MPLDGLSHRRLCVDIQNNAVSSRLSALRNSSGLHEVKIYSCTPHSSEYACSDSTLARSSCSFHA